MLVPEVILVGRGTQVAGWMASLYLPPPEFYVILFSYEYDISVSRSTHRVPFLFENGRLDFGGSPSTIRRDKNARHILYAVGSGGGVGGGGGYCVCDPGSSLRAIGREQ